MLTVVTRCCVFISQDAEETLSSSSHEGFVAREHYVTSLPPRPWASLGRHGGGKCTCTCINTYMHEHIHMIYTCKVVPPFCDHFSLLSYIGHLILCHGHIILFVFKLLWNAYILHWLSSPLSTHRIICSVVTSFGCRTPSQFAPHNGQTHAALLPNTKHLMFFLRVTCARPCLYVHVSVQSNVVCLHYSVKQCQYVDTHYLHLRGIVLTHWLPHTCT